MTVRTRFAPSPTGYLHIGGVRTALFNWLLARRHGGQFILRIDDTDQQRNVEASLAPILHSFRWLGIDWDEGPEIGGPRGPYFQSQKAERYREAVDRLLSCGAAYRDFATPAELQSEREAAQAAGRSFTYSRRWRADDDATADRYRDEGRAGVVRLAMPRDGELVLQDLVRGEVRFDWAKEQDHVIQRADGTCLYHLATVVDDHDMGVSHVVRAEEHLPNTPRQVFIAQRLYGGDAGHDPSPRFAHLPLVAEPGSKNKLSKRKLAKYLKHPDFAALNDHGRRIADRLGLLGDGGRALPAEVFNPVVVDFYEQVGYLPDAVINYLLLLGWSLDDAKEDFTTEEMIAAFSLDRVGRAPASFDPAKLLAFQQRAMQRLPVKRRTPVCLGFLQRAGLLPDPAPCSAGEQVSAILSAAGDRIKVAGDILEYGHIFTDDHALEYDEKAVAKRLVKPAEAAGLLADFRADLAAVAPFTAAATEAALGEFLERRGVKIGQIIHALRVATTGKAVGFGMFETLEILGRDRTLARIDRTLCRVAGSSDG